jgi:hypothetical protein
MSEKEWLNQYQICDRILEYVSEHSNDWHNPYDIRDKFMSSVAIEKVKYLFDFMALTEQPEPATFQRSFKHNCWEIKKNEYTEEFLRNGGFTKKYEELLEEELAEEQLKELEKQKLKLETENLKYQKTIRDQEQRIRNLSEQNSSIELLKNYWWLILFSIGLGFLLAEIINLL